MDVGRCSPRLEHRTSAENRSMVGHIKTLFNNSRLVAIKCYYQYQVLNNWYREFKCQ